MRTADAYVAAAVADDVAAAAAAAGQQHHRTADVSHTHWANVVSCDWECDSCCCFCCNCDTLNVAVSSYSDSFPLLLLWTSAVSSLPWQTIDCNAESDDTNAFTSSHELNMQENRTWMLPTFWRCVALRCAESSRILQGIQYSNLNSGHWLYYALAALVTSEWVWTSVAGVQTWSRSIVSSCLAFYAIASRSRSRGCSCSRSRSHCRSRRRLLPGPRRDLKLSVRWMT